MSSPNKFDRGMLPSDSSLSRIAQGEEDALKEIKAVIDDSNDSQLNDWWNEEMQDIKVMTSRLVNWRALKEVTEDNPELQNEIATLVKDFRDVLSPICVPVPAPEEPSDNRVGITDKRALERFKKNPIFKHAQARRLAS